MDDLESSFSSQRIGKIRSDVVTFNYDTLLDSIVNNHPRIRPVYFLDEDGSSITSEWPSLTVLKLHGSLDWIACSNCGMVSKNNYTVPWLDKLPINDQLSEAVKLPTARSLCKCKNHERRLERLLIPPTWSKALTSTRLRSVWSKAIDVIKHSMQIVIIGYSMPETDTFLSYLFALGLEKNSDLNRIVIVNKHIDESLEARYDRVFSSSMRSRGRVLYLNESFEEFVAKGGNMERLAKKRFEPRTS